MAISSLDRKMAAICAKLPISYTEETPKSILFKFYFPNPNIDEPIWKPCLSTLVSKSSRA